MNPLFNTNILSMAAALKRRGPEEPFDPMAETERRKRFGGPTLPVGESKEEGPPEDLNLGDLALLRRDLTGRRLGSAIFAKPSPPTPQTGPTRQGGPFAQLPQVTDWLPAMRQRGGPAWMKPGAPLLAPHTGASAEGVGGRMELAELLASEPKLERRAPSEPPGKPERKNWWHRLGGTGQALLSALAIWGLSRLRGGARESAGNIAQAVGQGLLARAKQQETEYERQRQEAYRRERLDIDRLRAEAQLATAYTLGDLYASQAGYYRQLPGIKLHTERMRALEGLADDLRQEGYGIYQVTDQGLEFVAPTKPDEDVLDRTDKLLRTAGRMKDLMEPGDEPKTLSDPETGTTIVVRKGTGREVEVYAPWGEKFTLYPDNPSDPRNLPYKNAMSNHYALQLDEDRFVREYLDKMPGIEKTRRQIRDEYEVKARAAYQREIQPLMLERARAGAAPPDPSELSPSILRGMERDIGAMDAMEYMDVHKSLGQPAADLWARKRWPIWGAVHRTAFLRVLAEAGISPDLTPPEQEE